MSVCVCLDRHVIFILEYSDEYTCTHMSSTCVHQICIPKCRDQRRGEQLRGRTEPRGRQKQFHA